MPGYAHIRDLIQLELEQRIQEGCVVERQEWLERIAALLATDTDAMRNLYEELARIEPPADVPFDELASLKVIREMRPNGVRDMGPPEDSRKEFDRIHGGWAGLCIGAMMGLPFQTPPYTDDPEMRQPNRVHQWVAGAEAWPLRNYAPLESRAALSGLSIAHPEATSEEIRAAEPCEAIHAALCALTVLETAGADFATHEAARAWLARVPFDQTHHAQTQACMNLLHEEATARTGVDPEEIAMIDWERVATRMNPYRERNDAAMRGLVYGLACPGRPERAAELAWRDARICHTRNGLYAAMFLAALAAAAFREKSIEHLVEIGLSEVPPQARLSGAVRETLRAAGELGDWEACWKRAMDRDGAYGPDHAIPNTVLCLVALLYGEWDFTKSVALAVRGGFSPSLNAAVVGAIAGIHHTSRGLPPELVTPLNNSFHSHMPGAASGTISDLARRCLSASQPTGDA